MITGTHRTELSKLAATLLVLLFAAFTLHAQEDKDKDKPRERPRPAGQPPAHNSRPDNPAPAQRSAPAGEPQVRREPRTEPRTDARPADAQHERRQAPPDARPAPGTPATGQRPERQQPVPNDRPAGMQNTQPRPSDRQGGVPNNQPRPNDRPAGVPDNQPRPTDRQGGFQNNQPRPTDRQGGFQNNQPRPTDRPGGFQNNQPGQPGRQFGNNNRPGGAPARVVTTTRGDTIHRDPGGRVSEVHMRNGAVVYHPPSGIRRVEVVRPGGRVVVASAPGRGYVQRQVVINNRTIVKRTYIVNGASYARVYRPVPYRGIVFNVYTPVRYYRPAFYVYAYNPWARPVIYNWGWAGAPWYGYYGGYFSPYPSYASPTLWLTDYLVAATLRSAYEERMAASAPPPPEYYQQGGGEVALTPEVKQSIADEVRRQIDQERAEGQSNGSGNDTPVFADNGQHIFVAYTSLAVNSNAGECTIGEGSVLQMSGAPPQNSNSAEVVVLAGRARDCRKGTVAYVQLQDLQEMQNHMRETLDRGLGDLQSHQGQNGIPALPAGASGTIDSPYAAEAQPDTNVNAELTQVVRETDQAEQTALTDSDGAPPTLTLGLTIDEVKVIQGEPQKIVDLGAKKIYVYRDLKITFTDGRATDIQ